MYTPFPSGTVATSIIGSLMITSIECPSCLENGPFLVPYGDKLFDMRLTNNSLITFEIDTFSGQPTVRLNASVPFNPDCRPSHLSRSVYNSENLYVVFHSCPTWNPRRDENGAISPPPNTQDTNIGPSTVSDDSIEDYFIAVGENAITVTQVSANIEPVDIEPASDQCVEYTNVYPLRCPSAVNDELIDFIVECRTADQSLKLFAVHYELFLDELSVDELRGITGIPLSFENIDYIAIRHNSELIIVNYRDLTQSPGRRTLFGRIEATYFYQVDNKTWLAVVIPNHNLFIVDVDEFVITRGGDVSVYELPNTNAGSCDPTCLPQRLITDKHLMLAIQNIQSSYDFVAVNLNASTPSEISRVERITERSSFLVQFQEGAAPPTSADTTTTGAETEITVNPMTTDEHPTVTTAHTNPPVSPSRSPVHVSVYIALPAAGVVLALGVVILIIIGVVCAKKQQQKELIQPIPEVGRSDTTTSSLSDRSSLSSVGVEPNPPIQEQGQAVNV